MLQDGGLHLHLAAARLPARRAADGGGVVAVRARYAAAGSTAGSGACSSSRPALYSLGHGGNDAQKTIGIIWMLLIAAGYARRRSDPVPAWVIVALLRRHRAGHAVRRLAHRQDHGPAHHQAEAGGRLLRRDRRRDHAVPRHRRSASRCRPRTPSPARSSASARRRTSPRCAGAWPATSSGPGSSRSRARRSSRRSPGPRGGPCFPSACGCAGAELLHLELHLDLAGALEAQRHAGSARPSSAAARCRPASGARRRAQLEALARRNLEGAHLAHLRHLAGVLGDVHLHALGHRRSRRRQQPVGLRALVADLEVADRRPWRPAAWRATRGGASRCRPSRESGRTRQWRKTATRKKSTSLETHFPVFLFLQLAPEDLAGGGLGQRRRRTPPRAAP